MSHVNYISVLTGILMVSGCGDAPQNDEIVIQKEYFQAASEHEFTPNEAPDTILISGRSVIFFAPGAGELDQLVNDQDTRDGVRQAIGDFAYYASIVSDSLDANDIRVRFTERSQLVFDQPGNQHSIFPRESNSLLGVVLFDGFENIKVFNGMQTHLSVLSSAEHFFAMEASESLDLLDYFKPTESLQIHVYSSHSDILNQTGTRIDPSYYQKFGPALATRADRFQMSIFAYFKLQLADSVYGMVCRVPSKYDESSVRLYLWDQATNTILDQLELAENIWNEQWIMVKDSWLSVTPDKTLRIIQRKKEARMSEGQRTEADSLYHWAWTGSGFQSLPTSQLQTKNFPLKDWESYQQAAPPSELTFTDENYVWLPLPTGDLSWENILMQMPKPFTLDKEPIENLLAPGQIDTLLTVSQDGISFKFYRSPISTVVVEGQVTNPAIQFKQGLRIGLEKRQLGGIFQQLAGESTIPDLVKISSKQGDRVLSIHFKDDLLSTIEITNYIH